ncbi:hypothetical protein [Mucilaginibacter sp.]|uniref:hypothetical protein n=1 Tax=Mucilaginibacter sp. TaxID=1882438 RepID=UPI002610D4EE|nr:hypothetical protein [Mucilaginibacter sp.]MDB4926886.1 hypothetical protein [Mucilaginibacter sp.]
MSKNIPLIILCSIFLVSCKPSVKPEDLYGKWKYIRVQNPNANPPDSVNAMTLREQAPYIQFTIKDSLLIFWDGKVLSHGTFRMDGRNIIVKEILADGKTREFPFYVEELTDKRLIFSTKGTDGSEVTAVKQ